jgi:hypothetical protein
MLNVPGINLLTPETLNPIIIPSPENVLPRLGLLKQITTSPSTICSTEFGNGKIRRVGKNPEFKKTGIVCVVD